MRKNIKLRIEGMHCASCEVLIERRLMKIHGIKKVGVNHMTGEAEICCTREPDLAKLQAAVQDQGYTIHPIEAYVPTKKNTSRDYVEIGGVFLLLIAGYLLLKRLDFLPSIDVSQNMGYGVVFVIGLIAAASTCLAVTGGVLLAVAAKYGEQHPNLSGAKRFKPHLYFNIGRVISYALLGALLGLLGGLISFSSAASGIVTILASLLMIFLGLQMLHLLPFMGRMHVKMPKFLAHRIYDKSTKEYKPTAPFLLGASSFFLPCGFTQALQLYVLTTGDPIVGGLTMLVFSLGTLPSLLSLGAISSFVKGSVQKHFIRVAAVLVILLGVLSISSGLNLAGVDAAFLQKDQGGALAPLIDGKQVVQMSVDGLTYTPHRFTVLEGVPVRWEIDGRNAQGCGRVITIPKLGRTETLPKDSIKVIEFTPTQTGTISFSCTMGMTTPGSAFEVIANPAV
jgi:uncharacterized protein